MTTRQKVPTRRRFTVEEYHQMGEAGILGPEDRTELIDGEIIQMPPIGDWHQETVDRSTEFFVLRFGDVARIRIQGPVTLDGYSEPQPDVMLLRRKPGFYSTGHPAPDDVLLAIEISDTTARFDRERKSRLYARRGIAEMWQIERRRDLIVVFRSPTTEGYSNIQILRRGDSLAPLAFPDRMIAVTDLLGETS